MNIFYLLFFQLFLFSAVVAKELKTLVLIIASDDSPIYVDYQRLWKTYMHLDPEHFQCFFIKADETLNTDVVIKDDTIWCKTKEQYSMPGLLNKTLMSLEYFFNQSHEFDYVLRTNLSSFIYFPHLYSYLKNMPPKKCYAGICHESQLTSGPKRWVCGAGIILSKDLAESLIYHKKELLETRFIDCKNFDDVVMGHFFTSQHIPIRSSKHLEILSLDDWKQAWKKIFKKTQGDLFHYRIKLPAKKRREYEPAIHKKLIRTYYHIEA